METQTPKQMSMLYVLLLLLLLLPQTNCTPNTIIKILLETKHQLVQPDSSTNQLSDWIPSSSPCNWTGITCNPSTSELISINLNSLNLTARFPSGFCRIPTLQTLSIADNFLSGNLASSEISLCYHIHFLNLSSNVFVGNLPEFTPVFPNLTVLDLSVNNFTGDIPPSFGKFPKLQKLRLFGNLLNGTIPSYLGYLPELTSLELADNNFIPSPLPGEIGKLHKLEFLWLRGTSLIGEIPESIMQLVALKSIDVSVNSLSGEVPPSIGKLKNLTDIIIFDNKLSGGLPDSLGDLTNLRNFDASQNNLTGNLPEKLAGLQLLTLNLNDNQLQGQIAATLCLNKNLKELKLFNNRFSGHLPECLGVNSHLDHFDVSNNSFVGKFPAFLCKGMKLTRLIAFSNRFSGILSENYGHCDSLYYVRVSNNALSGEVPVGLWSHPRIYFLEVSNNRFEGAVHPSISNARNLSTLAISGNSFSGGIPAGVCRLRFMAVLDASRNRFSGELPGCITEMKNIQSLKLEQNMLSGNIPSNVRSWRCLTELNMAGNRLTGEIPRELGYLPVLNNVDLSNNLLSGEIPHELMNLKLNKFNFSVNNLQGRIPAGFSSELYVSSLIGNPNLCSEDLKPFRSCSNKRITMRFVVAIICGLLSVALLSVLLFLMRKRMMIGQRRKLSWKLTSFQRLNFNEKDLSAFLTANNLIGSGGSGNVYKAKLKTGDIYAVKRLWVDYEKPESESVFNSEVETLSTIRHVNIVKLLFSCVGERCRILGYEYMENGSLGDVLHGEKGGILLDWSKRFSIAVGAAQGLAYLHHDCIPPIVHRDVKSNNILLDEEFRPRIADFGLAKTLDREENDTENAMSCVAGSYGYIAPEYAYTLKVTEMSDVYSFGVVLMELVTGKRPIDPSFSDDKDIVKWVTGAASQEDEMGGRCSNLERLLDDRLSLSSCEYDEMEKVLNIALMCTSALPLNRPSMRKVVELLKDRRGVTSLGTACLK